MPIINDEDRHLIYVPPGFDSGRDQRDPHRPRTILYHQHIAPEGQFFEAGQTERLDKNWVDSPAKFLSKENYIKQVAEQASDLEKRRAEKEKATKEGMAAAKRIAKSGLDESSNIPKMPEKKIQIVKPVNGPKIK
ncbi:MAG: hypothetical protein BMS9Abin31_0702 [Gammaproteobacteria bacterium]|nr:MAG: hypothetical protein BMS9Abin31_0702 [Gammaproteobacteria bacterium]